MAVTGPVGGEPQRAVRRPDGLGGPLPRPTGEPLARVDATVDEVRDPDLGGVPRHVRVVPLGPRQVAPRSLSPGTATKSGPVTRTASSPVEVSMRTISFLGSPSPRWSSRTATSQVPSGATSMSRVAAALRRQRDRLAARVEAVEALVGPVGEEDDAVVDPPRAAAVLVDPRAGGEAVRQDVGRRAVGRAAHELDPAALLGATLVPPEVVAVGLDLVEADRALDQVLGRDRRGPGPVRRRRSSPEQLGEAADALLHVVGVQRVREAGVAGRAERLAGDEGDLGLLRGRGRPAPAWSSASGPRSSGRARPRTTGRRRTRPAGACSSRRRSR